MQKTNQTSEAVVSVVMSATSAFAQDFNKGVGAYNAGDYATAIQEFRPLAEQGVASAYYG